MPYQRRPPRLRPTIYPIVIAGFRFLYNIATRRHVTGLENVPQGGSFIMVSNHLSYSDVPLIGVEMPFMTYALAAEKYQHHPIFRPILDVGGAIFINRGEPDRAALRLALKVLENGGILSVAIEGTRSKTGGLQVGKTGPAYLATRAGVPLLPVVVYGTESTFANLRRLRRTDVYTVVGPLIHLPEEHARSEQLEAYTEHIMLTLAAMLPPRYRGVYADHPRLPEYLNSNAAN